MRVVMPLHRTKSSFWAIVDILPGCDFLCDANRHGSLLGLMFPGLEKLSVASMEAPMGLPRQAQIVTAAMPLLQSLSLPSCKVMLSSNHDMMLPEARLRMSG